MLEAPVVSELLSAFRWLYFAAALLGAIAAWRLMPRRGLKIGGAILVASLFAYWPVSEIIELRRQAAEYMTRYNAAKARFEDHCKHAGEKIIRTVDDVDGIVLMKLRTRENVGDGHEQMAPGAAFFREHLGSEFLESFLWFERMESVTPGGRGFFDKDKTPKPGYSFVDYASAGEVFRYGLRPIPDSYPPHNVRIRMVHEAPSSPLPRYAVTYEDLVDPDDRRHWVAGSIIQIVDLQENKIIAEHKRYAFDPGLGSRAGGRAPWGEALHCPNRKHIAGEKTRYIVDQILKPKKGN